MGLQNISIDLDVDPEVVLDSINISDILDYLGEGEFLDNIENSAIVEHVGWEELLDEIGEEKVREYFEIKDAD